MRTLAALLLFSLPSVAAAQTLEQRATAWEPAAPYVAAGQDEPGYRNWDVAAPWHAAGVKAFHDYLTEWGVAGIAPTWQLLRTATDWQKCGAQPFEIPPTSAWPNIVQTLRFIRDKVIPAIGPVEPVSFYRNPALNICAGGAVESAHRYAQAVDLVPLRPIARETLIRDLCAIHAQGGEPYGVGLGFYAFLRFHIDSRRFRRWGYGDTPEAAACASEDPMLNVAHEAEPFVPAATDKPQDVPPN